MVVELRLRRRKFNQQVPLGIGMMQIAELPFRLVNVVRIGAKKH